MNLRYLEGAHVADQCISRHNQQSSMGISFEDEIGALLLLVSLPDTWETLKVALCSSTPNSVITWNLVKTKVFNEETRRIAELLVT